jgi:hypothetical protein
MVLPGYCSESLELASVLTSTWAASAAVGDTDGQRVALLAFNRCFLHLIPVLTRQEELDANAAALERALA